MATVVVSTYKVASYLEGGGHFWVYMQYVQGLQRLGCDVYWLEKLRSTCNAGQDAARVAEFLKRMDRFGLGGKCILYYDQLKDGSGGVSRSYTGTTLSQAEALFRRTDLLLNFHYAIDPAFLALFRRTALVDIDPGLLQTWIATGQLAPPPHDVYFSTGETVGTVRARFPDCGIAWQRIRPPVSLERWPYTHDPTSEAFTTVSSWWSHDWVKDARGVLFDNNKRVSFMGFVELPRLTSQKLELALCLGTKPHDFEDRQMLERRGWRVRHGHEVAGTPEMYQAYIQRSRGEFSCAKPTCMKFQGAWVSDRTLCYLASGKPVVVQHTGPSAFLPNGEGMFRFTTAEEAVGGFEAINANYERHCRKAREITEAYFDSVQIAEFILNAALREGGSALPCAAVQGKEVTSQIHER
jgi:hypothetical protein